MDAPVHSSVVVAVQKTAEGQRHPACGADARKGRANLCVVSDSQPRAKHPRSSIAAQSESYTPNDEAAEHQLC